MALSGAYDLSIKERLRNELVHFRSSVCLVLDLTRVSLCPESLKVAHSAIEFAELRGIK